MDQEVWLHTSVSKTCIEYGYNPPNTILVSFQVLDKKDVIQMQMNNQGFNAEQITRIYIYIQGVNTIWKIKSKEQVNIANSQKVKWFFWHVSTLFKDLRLVVSIQTNHTFTLFDSIERLFFSYKVFPHWAHDSSVVWVSVVGRLYSVQYKSIFGTPDKVRRDTCEEARPSRLDFLRDEAVLDIKTCHVIASMQD